MILGRFRATKRCASCRARPMPKDASWRLCGCPIISSRASAQYFADWAQLAGAPETHEKTFAEGVRVEQNRWSVGGARTEVELVTIHGGGHGLPQPYTRRPRLLGPSPMAPDGPAMIWAYFERQPK